MARLVQLLSILQLLTAPAPGYAQGPYPASTASAAVIASPAHSRFGSLIRPSGVTVASGATGKSFHPAAKTGLTRPPWPGDRTPTTYPSLVAGRKG